MRVTLFACGPAANESELKSFQHLKSRLQSEPGEEEWVLLTNLAFSVTHQLQSDEIDVVAVGPSGVRVVEVKHWTPQWCDANLSEVEHAADRLTNKARKVGTTLRRIEPQLPRVDGAILLTQESSKAKKIPAMQFRGVGLNTLSEWRTAIGFDRPRVFSAAQVRRLASLLQPRSGVAFDGSLRRLAGYVNLELQTPEDQRFHRVYRGSHPARRDRVVLHLYDLSAVDDRNAEAKAKREFEALHRLQLCAWAPRILDSFQDAPGYEGEMYFFTVVDPAAPCINERIADTTWTSKNRLAFARTAVRALSELHSIGVTDGPIIHRNLSMQTILVKHDNTAILTGFERARLPSEASVTSSYIPGSDPRDTLSPEVQSQGLSAADRRSDIYSLCACLGQLFGTGDDVLLAERAKEVFSRGLTPEPGNRATLEELDAYVSRLLGESIATPPPPPARFWTEDQVIPFRERFYRIVSRLGSGGVGTTFKVVEIERSTGKDLGTYVAKVAHDRQTGLRVLHAYSLVRSHLRHTALSTIFEVATEWQENQFIALMTWVSGAPLSEFMGVFPLLAEEQQEASGEALALRWIRDICEALDVLHRNGLIHGDVSPRNLIVSGNDIVLTDYDFAGRLGEQPAAPGTVLYCSLSYQDRRASACSDDIYALAASFFHVFFEKEPFYYGGEADKNRGLNWQGISREQYPTLCSFLQRATSPDPQSRFRSVSEALAKLRVAENYPASSAAKDTLLARPETAIPLERRDRRESQSGLREQRVDWLLSLLQSYPGSRWGNRETRGLDTAFSAQTYVQTELERNLERDIRERRVRLVVLCGNAGDGKTALLQHLAVRLGLGDHPSSERIIEGRIAEGPLVVMNLDGSASWRGRSADEILAEFFAPFQHGQPQNDIVHLIAINDGRLLEWIEAAEAQQGGTETYLTAALYGSLQQQEAKDPHFRFISLNRRSLVGGVTPGAKTIDTTFLERLTNQLYGGEKAAEIWSPCNSCSAMDRCQVFQAARIFGPDNLASAIDPSVRRHARQRLFDSLQAVHLRGETHITMREVRAALVYILFGVQFCDEYHGQSADVLPYWERAFAPNSPARQGELLGELARFDPALEAHPQIDRHLVGSPIAEGDKTAPQYPNLTLESARRRAFFEWTPDEIEKVAGDRGAIDLARGRHLRGFRDLPLADESERRYLCERLCKGVSRLEDLPPQALERPGVVPLRVTPRTPTETAFWVEKPLSAFRLEASLPPSVDANERLHREAVLTYYYRNGGEERLQLGAELFHLLLELADGYQLGDVSTDDTFAHLSIFVQRLVREDEQQLLSWNPIQDEVIFSISAVMRKTEDEKRQLMVINPLDPGAVS
jgi:serine/threonine protein kinase